jgi:drug/metabolite transporter (DMT)-like permease
MTTVTPKTWGLTALTMMAFAANSLLCREALRHTAIDPASFTLIRIGAGAVVLALLARWRCEGRKGGNWGSALALVGYAVAFSFAYLSLSAGTGALLLFGAVQVTMIGRGLLAGERLRPAQSAGLLLALAGLVGLLAPGLSAPHPLGAGLMIVAGIAWGLYSLRGRGESDALAANAGNFLRGVPLAGAAFLAFAVLGAPSIDTPGLLLALASGGVASGMGYALWYVAVRGLPATHAATVQLSVPVITALAGAALLGESLSLRLGLASMAVLGGIALVVLRRR